MRIAIEELTDTEKIVLRDALDNYSPRVGGNGADAIRAQRRAIAHDLSLRLT